MHLTQSCTKVINFALFLRDLDVAFYLHSSPIVVELQQYPARKEAVFWGGVDYPIMLAPQSITKCDICQQ